MLSDEVKEYINKSVLCWLATSSADNQPNVSPKEVFTYFGDEYVIVANIASPGSVRNIHENPWVSISFVDVFVQKGYQLKGEAEIIKRSDPEFESVSKPLLEITNGIYPIASIIKIRIGEIKKIIAPSYKLFPDITEVQNMESAYKTYGVKPE